MRSSDTACIWTAIRNIELLLGKRVHYAARITSFYERCRRDTVLLRRLVETDLPKKRTSSAKNRFARRKSSLSLVTHTPTPQEWKVCLELFLEQDRAPRLFTPWLVPCLTSRWKPFCRGSRPFSPFFLSLHSNPVAPICSSVILPPSS